MRGQKDFLDFHFLGITRLHVWANRKDRTRDVAKHIFRYGTQHEPGDSMPAMRGQHQQVNLIALHYIADHFPHRALAQRRLAGQSRKKTVQHVRDIFCVCFPAVERDGECVRIKQVV